MAWARNRALNSMGRLNMATSELLMCFRQLTAAHLNISICSKEKETPKKKKKKNH